jgi:hypothetical protein
VKNGLAVFVSYLSKGDKCVLQLFELKSEEKDCDTETFSRIYEGGTKIILNVGTCRAVGYTAVWA